MVVRFYSSVAPETTLSAGITGASTSIQVGSVTGFPANTPYTLALDYEGATEELVQVNNAAGTTLTVTRAIDGTSAASHNAGARVRHVSSARDFSDSRTHENSDQGIHGLAVGDTLVGEDATQTLTNKTLNSPILNTPTINGATFTGADFSGTLHGTSTALVRLDNGTNVTPTSTNHAMQVGLTSSGNLRMDNNEIMAVNNGLTSTLGLQQSGGNVVVYNNVAADSVANAVIVNGVVTGTQIQSTRPGATTTTYSSRVTGDSNSRWLARADGALQFGSGAGAADVTVSRTGVGVLNVDNSLTVTNGLTVPAITASGTSTMNTLTVTNVFNPPVTTASGASVFTISAGWNLLYAVATKSAGHTTVSIGVTRTGVVIIPSSPSGNFTDEQLGTIALAWAPGGNINSQPITAHIDNGVGHGACRLNTDRTVDFTSWMPNDQIDAGTGNYRFTFNYPSN